MNPRLPHEFRPAFARACHRAWPCQLEGMAEGGFKPAARPTPVAPVRGGLRKIIVFGHLVGSMGDALQRHPLRGTAAPEVGTEMANRANDWLLHRAHRIQGPREV